MTDNDKKYGRTLFDIIGEHPKYMFGISILLIIIICVILIFKVPVKVGNLQIGENRKIQHDTIVIVKIDTLYIEKPKIERSIPSSESKIPHKKVSVKSADTTVIVQNQPANINTGTNSGIIGNNVTINNNGIQLRKITNQDIEFIKANFPDKTIQINFRVYGAADAEIYNVKKQLVNMLKQNGYNNIDEEFLMMIGYKPPERITINKTNSNGIIFEIPPATIQ